MGEPPKLELKPLPETLNYAYLGANKTLPVINAPNLSENLEESLLSVLIKNKECVKYVDSDYAGDLDKCRFTTDMCLHCPKN